MAVTPQYANAANESGEPHAPLYWVEGYSEDDQLAITSFGGEPYRRKTGTALPPDPGSPGWDPSQGTGEVPPVASLGWSQVDPGIVWTDIDPSIPWIGDTAVADDVTLGWVTTLAAPMSSGAFAGPYPDGISIFAMTPAQAAADGGWPLGVASQVMSVKSASDQMSQFWFRNTSGSSDAYYREVGVSWAGPWMQIAGQTQVAQILSVPLASSALASAYPTGYSLFYLTTAQATSDTGWPAQVAGTVMTITASSGQAAQFWFQSSATTPNVYYRSLSGTGISAWQQFIGGSIYAQVPALPAGSSDGSGSYPIGFSVFAVTLAQAQADGGWPTTGSLSVMTVKAPGTIASQFAMQNSSPNTWYRTLSSAVGSGTPWIQVAGQPTYAQIMATPLASSALPAAYPMGLSMAVVTPAFATTDGGFPEKQSAALMTVKTGTDRAMQFWSLDSATISEVWFRQLTTNSNTPWVQLAGQNNYRAQNSTATQNITSGVWTLLSITGAEAGATFGTDIVQSGNGMSVTRDGLYEVSILVTWNGGPTSTVVTIGVSTLTAAGAEGYYRNTAATAATTLALVQTAVFLRPMNAGDTIGVWAFQATGATQVVSSRRLVVRRLSD